MTTKTKSITVRLTRSQIELLQSAIDDSDAYLDECIRRADDGDAEDYRASQAGLAEVSRILDAAKGGHRSSDGTYIDGPEGRECGCQSCRHTFGTRGGK